MNPLTGTKTPHVGVAAAERAACARCGRVRWIRNNRTIPELCKDCKLVDSDYGKVKTR